MLVAILSIMGVLSLVYFGIIVVYSGIETSMAWFWPALGILCFLLAEGLRFYQQNRRRVPLRIPVTIVTLCITGLVVFVGLQVLIFSGMIRTDPEHLDYLITGPYIWKRFNQGISLILRNQLFPVVCFGCIRRHL